MVGFFLDHPEMIYNYYHLKAEPGKEAAIFHRVRDIPATPLVQFVFGGAQFESTAIREIGRIDWPVIWIHGDGCSGEDLAGTQVIAVRDRDVESVILDGRVVGRRFEDNAAEYLWLGGILPSDISASRADQAKEVFHKLDRISEVTGMGFEHIYRTWLYLANLLDWYDDFNQVRTAFFERHGVFDRLIPASTGIGAANPTGAAIGVGGMAIKPKPGSDITIQGVPSPLQCPATAYRSSFSRAVEVATRNSRMLCISGTASIAADGRSMCIGDVDAQIDRTMEVIAAILQSSGMSWGDAVRSIAYFKDIRAADRFPAYCKRKNLPEFPVNYAHAAVCRDDLLFEIELDAVK